MEIEFDPAKDRANVEKHGVSLARVGELEIFVVLEKSRPQEEGERRFRIYGLLRGAAYCAVLTWREGAARAISLRKANRMERRRHGLEVGT